jgi:hypothetical protein
MLPKIVGSSGRSFGGIAGLRQSSSSKAHPLKLDNTAFEEVANQPGDRIVPMPDEANDPYLGVAAPDLVRG